MRKIKIFLFASPHEASDVFKITRNCTFFSYFIDKEGLFRRKNTPFGNTSRLMYVSDYGTASCADADFQKLAADIARECRIRRFSWVFFDFETPQSALLLSYASQFIRSPGFTIFVPRMFAGNTSGAKTVISSSISGGSFSQMLRDAVSAYGCENICLDVSLTRKDFTMPSYMPEGRDISDRELCEITEKHSPSVFFSKDLCSKYFTYSENGEHHFVLFDDADTARAKLDIAEQMGIPYAFLLYSDFKENTASILK